MTFVHTGQGSGAFMALKLAKIKKIETTESPVCYLTRLNELSKSVKMRDHATHETYYGGTIRTKYLKQLEQFEPENSGRILETVGCSTQMNSPTPMSLVATA